MISGLHNVIEEMHLLYAETSQDGGGGWRAVGRRLGVSGAYARMIAMKQRPLTPELAARWLGEDDVVVTCRVPVCPTCGGVHIAGDCRGRPVASVVTLAPDEAVIKRNGKPQRERKARRNISVSPSVWDDSNARRIAAGMTWDEWEGR